MGAEFDVFFVLRRLIGFLGAGVYMFRVYQFKVFNGCRLRSFLCRVRDHLARMSRSGVGS